MFESRGRQMRCARQALHGTANRQLSNQESQFELELLLISLGLEMLHVLDKLEIIAYKQICFYGIDVGCATFAIYNSR